MKKPYFSALDGLRAISVFLVISVHVRTKTPWLRRVPGQLGVDVFFVLSGFLITTLLLREEENTGSIDIFPFYMRRFFRIIPIYLLVLCGYVAICYHNPVKWALLLAALPHYLTFTNEFVPWGAPYGFSWTLGIEEKFYLFWPLLYFVLLRGRARLLSLLLLYAALIGLLSFRMGRSYSGLLVGCILAIFLTSRAAPGAKRIISETPSSIFAGIALACFYLVSRNERFTFVFSWAIAALIANLQLSDSWLRKTLSMGWLTWIGRRSYGMYLIHGLVIDVVEAVVRPSNAFRQVSVAVLTLAGAALMAEPIFRFVEEPARRYGKMLIERRDASKRPAPERPKTPGMLAPTFKETTIEGGAL